MNHEHIAWRAAAAFAGPAAYARPGGSAVYVGPAVSLGDVGHGLGLCMASVSKQQPGREAGRHDVN